MTDCSATLGGDEDRGWWWLEDVPGLPFEAMTFAPVPEPKTVKNRVHLDLAPAVGTRDEEVSRVIRLGATQLADHRSPNGTGWVVLADPEGNEFCIERSEQERAGDPPAG